MIDFEADGPTPEASEENAATTYATTSPGLVAAIGSQAMDSMRMLGNAYSRGAYSDASAVDRGMVGMAAGAFGETGMEEPDDMLHAKSGGAMLPVDEVNKRFSAQDGSGKAVPIATAPMSEGLAALVSKQKQEQMDRDALFARYSANHGIVTNFAAGTAGFLLDPINAGSMFIPGLGEESILARLGTSNIATRTIARLGAGAASGVAQMAPIAALKYGLGTEEASDYDLRAAFKDVAMGAAVGAVAHAGLGGLREVGVLRPDEMMRGHGAVDLGAHPDTPAPAEPANVPPEDVDAVANASPQQREAAMKAGVAQIVDGREVDVSPMFPPPLAPEPRVDGTPAPDVPPSDLADVAQQQARIHANGFAPGIPQAEFDATTSRLYGPKTDAMPPPAAAPKPTTDAGGATRDPETEALESRVTSSPAFTAQDRAALVEANRGVEDAGRRADAYTHAGELLSQGETLGDDPFSLAAARAEADDVLPMVKAYHGTPHAFDRFDITKIGTGEGAQAYGHGLYFAENERVAKQYRDDLSPATQDISVGGKPFDYAAASEAEQRAFDSLYSEDQWVPDVDHAIEQTERRLKSVADLPRSAAKFQEQLDTLRGWKKQGLENKGGSQGHLYNVEIDREPEHFLDWDKSLSDHPPEQQRAVLSARFKDDAKAIKDAAAEPDYMSRSIGALIYDLGHSQVTGSPAAASADLSRRGIAGVRYLDGGSRGAGDGTRNYVVFNHEDVKITHRNGEAVTPEEKSDILAKVQERQDASSAAVAPTASAVDRTISNPRTGTSVVAQDVRPFADMMRAASIASDASADPLARASSLAIGESLRSRIGDLKVFTVGAEEMKALTANRMGLAEGIETAGFYDPSMHAIVALDGAMKNPAEASQLMVHEGLHAAFMRTINKSGATREVIDHLRQLATASHLEAGGAVADHYGLTNAHEFVSEAFSNPDFQRFLGGIEAPAYLVKAMGLDQPGLVRTLWDAFAGAVRKILGFAPEQQTLLDAAMRVGRYLDEGADDAAAQGAADGIAPSVRPAPNISRIEASVAARGSLGPGEARTLIREVAARAEQMRITGSKDPFVDAARELADKIKENARLDKLDALRNADVRTKLMTRIDTAGGIANAPEQLRSELHGTYKSGLDSVQAQYRGLASTLQGALSHKLHALGIEKAVISGAMDEDIAKELWAMNAGGGEGSGNKLARQAAEAIHPVLEELKTRLNGLGARIGDATDYVAQTRHDPYKMRRAAGSGKNSPEEAFQAWWKDTQPLLADKTFADLTPREGETMPDARKRFGRSVYQALLSGIHMTPDGISGVGFDPEGGARGAPAFEGTRNIAKKVSQERTLFWKDGPAWNSYVQRYGAQTSLTEGVMRSVNQGAKQIALMERFGTNPMANLQQIERALMERERADPEALTKFSSKMNGVRNVMSYLDGSAGIPQNALWASIGNNVRTAYSIFDLGGVGVTHFASIWPTVTSEMRQHGISRLEGLGNMVAALAKGSRTTAEKADILSDLGAYADGLTRDMQANWQPDSPQMGRMSSMANTFMKYTGIHYVFDHTQAAVRSMLSHNLARNLGKDFGELEPHLQGMLSSYGVGEKEWGLLRSTQGTLRTEAGRAYLTPKDVLDLEPAAVEAHLRETGALGEQGGLDLGDEDARTKAIGAFTAGLSDKLGAYFSDTAAHSTVTAGARERALLLGGTKAGSLSGETMRFLTQFKMWPVAAFDQLLKREIYMSTSKADAAWGIGSMAAFSAASGYLRMSINDYMKGNPVRSPWDWNTALAGLAQGGGLGIFGDFLFGEVNRMGGGLISTAGGPAVSDADSLLQIYNRFRRDATDPTVHHPNGTFADLWPDLAHFAVHHVPFANLVYLKGTLDYMLWYHLYEAASPGWWDRTNRRLQKEQGRTMQGYTPGGGVPIGIPALYLKNNSHSSGLFGSG